MNILFATSEAAPFAKTGGLGDVAGSLPITLKEKGTDTRVIMPLYNCIPQQFKDNMRYINHIYIDIGWRKQYCGIFEYEHQGCIYYFIDNKFYFSGNEPYSYIHYDCEKFIFFSKAVLSILPTIGFKPDVINCNDWQTGAIPVYLDTFQDNEFYRGIKTVMTIHNLRFQGRWSLKGIQDAMGISDYYFTEDKMEYHTDANLLKGGIVYADKVSTVSNTYAGEITTPEFGEGLDGLLNARSNDLWGIVNGISYVEWNPSTDDMIYEKYDEKSVFDKKVVNKTRLQGELGLPVDQNKFMIGIISRLTDQKGFDLLACEIENLCNENVQIVILGTGDEKYENLFRHYAWKYPENISSNIFFSNEKAHKIYAASDAFLMPSHFEPCGLSQLISLKYGTLPIVRETGGLKDTVVAYNEYTNEGNGFSFKNYAPNEMMHVIRYAIDIFYNKKESWNQLITNAMSADFSWNVSADKYIELYSEITGIQPEKKSDDVVLASKTAAKPKAKRTTKKSESKTKQSEKTVKGNKTTEPVKKVSKTTKKAKTQEQVEIKINKIDDTKENAKKDIKETSKTTTSEKAKKEKPIKDATKKSTKKVTKKQEPDVVPVLETKVDAQIAIVDDNPAIIAEEKKIVKDVKNALSVSEEIDKKSDLPKKNTTKNKNKSTKK